jgi:plastocyanin
MHFTTAAFVLASVAFASAADFPVLVGMDGLTFSPSLVTVNSGDSISFEFRGKNHSVTQSSFANPCTRLVTANGTGVDSGFQAVAAGASTFPVWNITIQDPSTPLWFYCAQTNPANHCKAGMVFAVNPTADKSFDAYQANAKASTPDTSSVSSGSGSLSTTATTGFPFTTAFSSFSSTPTGLGALPTTSTTNGSTNAGSNGSGALAVRMSGGATTLLAVVGLVVGLVL